MATPKFIGDIVGKWNKDGRKMTLQQDFIFLDSSGKEWLAPAGSVVENSQIPKIPWGTNDSPFIGKHRRASVIHEIYCSSRSEPHAAVHKMFYEAMIADSTPKGAAKEMYIAVVAFGPKWDTKGCDLVLDAVGNE